MTVPEGAPEPSFDIPAALIAAGMGAGPIENSRRLVPLGEETDGRVLEFYSSFTASRLLAIPQGSEDTNRHADLAMQGVPVLPRYGENPTTDLELLLVPPGTWSLGTRLHIVSRDVALYSNLLWTVGQSQRHQYDHGMGVIMPKGELRAVDHFVFTPDLRHGGQRLSVIPPYTIDPNATPSDFAETLLRELHESEHFTDQELLYLADAVRQGVEAPRAVENGDA
jgi:hypothetical protein